MHLIGRLHPLKSKSQLNPDALPEDGLGSLKQPDLGDSL